jgi:hypothetical protein
MFGNHKREWKSKSIKLDSKISPNFKPLEASRRDWKLSGEDF